MATNEHQDMDLDQSISDVERVVNLLAQLDEQQAGPSNLEPKDSIEMGSLGLASLYEPDELDMDFLGQTAPQRHLPSIALPSACSHQQSSVIGEHGMPVGGSEPRWRRPTATEQSPSSAADTGPMYQNPRSRFRGPQLEGLAVAYAANPFPTTEDKAALADELQLDTRAVQVCLPLALPLPLWEAPRSGACSPALPNHDPHPEPRPIPEGHPCPYPYPYGAGLVPEQARARAQGAGAAGQRAPAPQVD